MEAVYVKTESLLEVEHGPCFLTCYIVPAFVNDFVKDFSSLSYSRVDGSIIWSSTSMKAFVNANMSVRFLPLFQGLNKTIICPDCSKGSLETLGTTTSKEYL